MSNLDSSLEFRENEYASDEEVVDDDITDDEVEESEIKDAKSDEESVDDVARRKKVRRLLDLQLERRRLRKEIDFYSDYDEADDVEDDEV